MGNHEYCINCGESDFHYHRKCDPALVAKRIAKEKEDFERHEARVNLVIQKLQAAGIPFKITRWESLSQEPVYRYYRKIEIDIWKVELPQVSGNGGMADASDLKSDDRNSREGSTPSSRTTLEKEDPKLIDDLKKLLGFPPYNSPANICWNDGYFYKSIVSQYGETAVERVTTQLKNKYGQRL